MQKNLTLLKNYLTNNDYSYVSPASNLSLSSVSTRLNLAGSSVETFLSALSSKIITYIATFLASIPAGTIKTLIKIALTIVAVSVIIFLITAFFGMIEKGFYIGFIRNTAFDWRFICGTED